MEIKFEQKAIHYLRNIINDHKTQEQTQEIRLPDHMPDVGCVLGAWGQCVIRGKQWLGNSIEVSGGTMVWVIYKADQTEEINCIESWVPFQFSWEMHTYEPDGNISALCYLCSADARNTSTRKLMIRTEVSVSVDVYCENKSNAYILGNTDDHVQCLQQEYKFMIPKEAGEKTFSIEEDMSIPASYPQIDKILKSQLRIEITDKKVITQKVVFRGIAVVSVSYLAMDGTICCWEGEMPFSQYADLNYDFDDNCCIIPAPVLSGVEIKVIDDNRISVSAGIIFQYTIIGCEDIIVVQDAYCRGMNTTVNNNVLTIPTMLCHKDELLHLDHQIDIPANRIADVSVSFRKPVESHENEKVLLPCDIKITYYDKDAILHCERVVVQKIIGEKSPAPTRSLCNCTLSGSPKATVGVSGCNVVFDVLVCNLTTAEESVDMISGVEACEKEICAKQPSLVLCRRNNETMWEIAKRYGSTVEMLENLNALQNESSDDCVLIVPIS